jgi:hypothetical protein
MTTLRNTHINQRLHQNLHHLTLISWQDADAGAAINVQVSSKNKPTTECVQRLTWSY